MKRKIRQELSNSLEGPTSGVRKKSASPRRKIFTRTDEATTRATLDIYRAQLRTESRTVALFSTLIPLSHLLRFVAMPLCFSLIIQSLVNNPHDTATPLRLLMLVGVMMIVATLANDRGYTILFNHEERAHTRMLREGIANLMGRSYQFFTDQKVGTLAGDLMNYSRSYTTLLDTYFLSTNHLIVSFVVGMVVIGFLAPLLLLPTLCITILLVLLNIRNVHARAPYRNKRKLLTSQLTGTVADIMGNQLLVRVFAAETKESDVILHERQRIEDVSYDEIRVIERQSAIRQTMLYTFQLITVAMFIWLAAEDLVSVAGLVFTFSYINRSTDAIFGISQLIRQYEQVFLDAAPMVSILQSPLSVVDRKDAVDLHVTAGDISFSSVDFTYGDKGTDPVFSNLNLHIRSGQRVGLAGHSGGGKTTLTKLLLRFSDIDGGTITIDGQDISKVKQRSLRQHIAYVPQEPYLFHRTLRDNISYGNPGASERDIIRAATQANAWDFIQDLPDGLETIVGERGVKLSGGQRQRIAIARAILKDAPILILDEATSALDSESEQLIQHSLEQLMQGRTTIVIAHRLSTIAKLDRIVVLEEGSIIEDGTHQELLASNGIYAGLWSHQSGGFIEE